MIGNNCRVTRSSVQPDLQMNKAFKQSKTYDSAYAAENDPAVIRGAGQDYTQTQKKKKS